MSGKSYVNIFEKRISVVDQSMDEAQKLFQNTEKKEEEKDHYRELLISLSGKCCAKCKYTRLTDQTKDCSINGRSTKLFQITEKLLPLPGRNITV